MPLTGLRVIDLSRFLPGPQCAALLGDYGAEVIRVEQPKAVAARDRAQGIAGLEGAARARARAADVTGRGKRSVLIDFSTPEGRDRVLRLAAGADVLIHDFRPATIEAAGLDAATVRAAYPRLIYVAISATGATGPRAGQAGHDPVALALAGALARTAPEPHLFGFPAADTLTAAHAAFAIMVALRRRDTTGQGAELDVAMSDSALALMASVFARTQRCGSEPPLDFTLGDNAVFPASDGHVVATHLERPFWERFCAALGRPDLVGRFDDTSRRDETLAELRRIFAARSRAEWDRFSAEHDLQIAPVLSTAEALDEAQHHARGALVRDPETGVVLPGRPVRFSDLPQPRPRPAPEPGADSALLEGLE